MRRRDFLGFVIFMTARRMLLGARAGPFVQSDAVFPTDWNVSKFAGNPVITIPAGETREQYVPAPIRLASGDIWVYCKGASRIYAWKSTDNGETFTIQNGGFAVLEPDPGEWDQTWVLEPVAIYDAASNTIHIWYKGNDGNPNNWAWGHATAPDSDPTDVTRDVSNPIYTAAALRADTSTSTCTDMAISDVIVIGSTFHFYGYAYLDSRYRLVHASGTTWNDPSSGSVLLVAADADDVVECPSVVRMPGGGAAVYAMLYSIGFTSTNATEIRQASSSNGTTWDFSDTTAVMSAGSGWEDSADYAGSFLKATASPYSAPYVDGSNRWLFYYSGLQSGSPTVARIGLSYMTPT